MAVVLSLGAMDRLLRYDELAESVCSQVIPAAQHRPEGPTVCAAQQARRQQITNPLMYSSLLVRTTMPLQLDA